MKLVLQNLYTNVAGQFRGEPRTRNGAHPRSFRRASPRRVFLLETRISLANSERAINVFHLHFSLQPDSESKPRRPLPHGGDVNTEDNQKLSPDRSWKISISSFPSTVHQVICRWSPTLPSILVKLFQLFEHVRAREHEGTVTWMRAMAIEGKSWQKAEAKRVVADQNTEPFDRNAEIARRRDVEKNAARLKQHTVELHVDQKSEFIESLVY